MKRVHKKRTPSPSARQTWDAFVRLPAFWEEIKQRIILGAVENKGYPPNVLLNTHGI